MPKIITTLLFGALSALSFFVISGLYYIYTPLTTITSDTLFIVAPGSSLNKVAYQLQVKSLLDKPRYFILWGHLKQQTRQIKAGEYRFTVGVTPWQLFEQLVNGQVVQHTITFIEGWTIHDVLQALKNNPKIDHQLDSVSLKEIMAKLGKPGDNPEGQFFPDTYHFVRATTDIDILKRAYQAMQQKLQTLWQQRAQDTPYKSPYEALIVASLVEKESAIAGERPLIAGIIIKRLQKNMLLQIDPSVIYGLGEKYNGSLAKRDLQKDSPYNTYRRRGLPPTPIALPSESSLAAALKPQASDYLYFVAKGDGSHAFSKTLKEQQQAINKYIRNRDKK